MTKGKFGFHRCGGENETGTAAYVQIYVKSSALSRAPDLAISVHLMTEAEIDARTGTAGRERSQRISRSTRPIDEPARHSRRQGSRA